MKRLNLALILALAITASAAEKTENAVQPNTGSTDVRKETGEAVDAVAAKARQERDEFVGKAQKEMAELNNKLAELKHKAAKLSGKAKARMDRQISEMEPDLKAAEQKLADLKSAASEKWDELKSGVSTALRRVKHTIQKNGGGDR